VINSTDDQQKRESSKKREKETKKPLDLSDAVFQGPTGRGKRWYKNEKRLYLRKRHQKGGREGGFPHKLLVLERPDEKTRAWHCGCGTHPRAG